MKQGRRTKKAKYIRRSLIMVVLVLVGFVAGAWVGTAVLSTRENKNEVVQNEGTEVLENREGTNELVVYEIKDSEIVVPTPYGDLFYPAEFEEFLRIKHEFSEENYAVHFNADFMGTGNKNNLFTVYFAKNDGTQPEGTILGGVPDKDGNIMLIIVITNSSLPNPEWDQDTANLVYAMQEGISFCTERIERMDNIVFDR